MSIHEYDIKTHNYNITPVSKPRMTQSDKWKQRPAVMRYWAFKDVVRKAGITLPDHARVDFIIPMPASWSKKKKAEMAGFPHRQKPDWDNLGKALSDAIYDDDSHIWSITIVKFWGYKGKIVIYG